MTAPAAPSPPLSSVLRVVSGAALADLAPLWVLAPADLGEALPDVLPGLVDTWALASAAAAADWYDELRDTEDIDGRFAAIVDELGDLGAQALAGWAAEPLRQAEPDVAAARYRVEGGLSKRVVNAGNRTVTGSAAEDPQARGWMRRTGGGACKFCVMVASRGAVYTRSSSTFACHEHCFCSAAPVWGDKPLPVKPFKRSDRPSSAGDRARVRRWIADNL